MAQWSRAPAALSEDPTLMSGSSQTPGTPALGNQYPLLALLHGIYRYTDIKKSH